MKRSLAILTGILLAILMTILIVSPAFTASDKTLTIQISGVSNDISSSTTIITLNGTAYSGFTFSGGVLSKSITFPAGSTINYSFQSPLSSSISGKQYIWVSTSGMAQTNRSGSFSIASGGTLAATYKTQYKLTFTQSGISSDAGSHTVLTVGTTNYAYNALPNDVWIDSGTTFSWTAAVAGITGEQFVKTASSGLASPITSSGTSSATYKTQYYLTVNSAHDTPGGAGWYDSGSDTSATLTSGTVPGGSDTQYIFTGWSGDASGTGLTSNSITMNGPKTATANWKTQYKVSFSQTGINSDAGANTVLTIGSTDFAYNALPSNAWMDSGTTFSWESIVAGGIGEQFVRAATSGVASPITSSGTSSATYNVQYQSYTVTFDKNGGDTDAVPSSAQTTYGGTVSLPITNPTKADSIFSGWNTEKDGSGTAFTELTQVKGDITVYAKWTAPVPPVPELPSSILFALGVLGLIGFAYFGGKRAKAARK